MVGVRLSLTPLSGALLALVAPHGLTDLNKPRVFERYAAWLALPLPPFGITLLFCAASVAHLRSELGGRGGSLLVHALVHELHRLLGAQAAFDAFMVYFAFVHTPLHYLTELVHGNGALVCACLAVSAALCAAGSALVRDGTWVLTDAMQRLVVAHVVTTAHARAAREESAARMPGFRWPTRFSVSW